LFFYNKENPISSEANYRNEIIMRLPNLKKIDKDEITSEDREAAEEVIRINN